jgi:CheY-like chemotaxis protein
MQIETVVCSPIEIVASVASLMRVQAEAKSLPLTIEYAGPIPHQIQSDPTRLRQILINLVANAVKFTEVGSVRLAVRLLSSDGSPPCLQFDVIDTGIGMTEQQTARVFRPFTQADSSTTRKFGGSGLGLTISQRLARLLSGDIAVQSTLGEGSTFSLTVATGSLDGVPMVERPEEARLEPVAGPDSPRSEKVCLSCRVLLVEDGRDNQRLIGFLLKKAGAEVIVADNGEMGVNLALATRSEAIPFDVILMDMQMPVLDGYQATRRLRDEGCQWPIVALTAHAMEGDRQKCLDAGCDDYMTKPLERETLLAMVAKHAVKQTVDG